MGFFDKITKIAERAADAVVKTSDKIAQTYQEQGFDGIVNKTTDSLNKATQGTQSYFKNISQENKKIMESIPEKDLEGTIAKMAAVVINTTETLAKDAAKATMETVDNVSKNIQNIIEEQKVSEQTDISTVNTPKEETKQTTIKARDLFLNQGEIAELDCMPIELFMKHLGAECNIDNNKFKLDGYTISTSNQKWFDWNNQKGGIGAITLVSHYVRIKNNLLDNINKEISKEVYHSSLEVLSQIFKLQEYQKDLSSWIQKNQPKKHEPIDSVSEEVPVTSVKKARKPKIEKTEPVEIVEPVKSVKKTPAKKLLKK